jgi:SAM-dependent methyltransferase
MTGTAEWDARLSTPGSPVCAPDWLALREPADAAARSPELVEAVRPHLAGSPTVVRDLGCGSGSMGRWLAPRLPGPQTWVLHDRDPDLLAIAAAGLPVAAADGAPVTARTHRGDLTALRAGDLAGTPLVPRTSLVTASALLDLLTADELEALAGACVAAGCPALLTLSVTGGARLVPADPLDAVVAEAFDAHQRRTDAGRRLLGPDAGAVAVAAFDRLGATVLTRPSPWRLGAAEAELPGNVELTEEWLRGWLAAACDQRPQLAEHAADYLHRRLDALAAGRLQVTVGHLDVLALPARTRDARPEQAR